MEASAALAHDDPAGLDLLAALGVASVIATFVFVHDREIVSSAATEPEFYSPGA